MTVSSLVAVHSKIEEDRHHKADREHAQIQDGEDGPPRVNRVRVIHWIGVLDLVLLRCVPILDPFDRHRDDTIVDNVVDYDDDDDDDDDDDEIVSLETSK